MIDIKSIAILGAGALGAAFAGMLYDLDPACVALVAGGERGTRLRQAGLRVNGTAYPIPVLAPDDDTAPPADLVIVALKHHHLVEAIHDIKHQVGPDTILLSVMNGLDSEPMLGAVYGSEKILYAISVGIDAQRQGNVINYAHQGRLIFGEADNTTLSDRVLAVQALFDRAGIVYQTPPDMVRMMWWKFMVNVGVNQASAVLNAPYHVMQTVHPAQAVMEAAMREVITCAQAASVDLTEQDLAEWYPVLNTLAPAGRTSMAQDIQAGRKTEVEIFAGKVVRLGEEYNIPTPVNETLLNLIHALEAV
ncbi:ketopantoate reductase family protein [Chloroflexota bacterium]